MAHYFQMDPVTIVNLDNGTEFSLNPETGDVQCFYSGVQRLITSTTTREYGVEVTRYEYDRPNTAHGILAAMLWKRLLLLVERSNQEVKGLLYEGH